MSAYIVSENLLNELVNYALTKKVYVYHNKTAYSIDNKKLAVQFLDVLNAENYKSVNYRYNEKTKPIAVEFKQNYINYTVEQIAYLGDRLSEYEYQTCEHKTFRSSLANAFVESMQKHLLRNLSDLVSTKKEIKELTKPVEVKPANQRLPKQDYFLIKYWYCLDNNWQSKAKYFKGKLETLGINTRSLCRIYSKKEVKEILIGLNRA